MRFEQQITVNAPPERVFDYVSDLTRMTEWGLFTNEVRQTSTGPVGVGSTFETTGRQFGKHTDRVRVTEYEPGKRFAVESTGDAGVVRHWFDLLGEGGSTRLTKGMEVVRPALTMRIFSPVVRRVAPKGLAKDLERIKARIEASV